MCLTGVYRPADECLVYSFGYDKMKHKIRHACSTRCSDVPLIEVKEVKIKVLAAAAAAAVVVY